jgi:hypothetical protein
MVFAAAGTAPIKAQCYVNEKHGTDAREKHGNQVPTFLGLQLVGHYSSLKPVDGGVKM